MGYKVAVVGATGAVGREMLQTLAERNFPADKVYALASSKSVGQLRLQRKFNCYLGTNLTQTSAISANQPW